ncbi:MAG: RNA polymerase subunit sigma-70 [Alphaproteobacteria bacterium]|nr:RNA polymerase subunit sigma-70 [Alphaproteobacteria bacterium]
MNRILSDDLSAHRPALVAHCYRMLGSPVDADDAVQETLLRATRGLGDFEGRASTRTWLLRIATNVCVDELRRRRRRRTLPMEAPPGRAHDPITFRPAEEWIEPLPDAWIVPEGEDPHAATASREGVRLAFVAALQQLPATQRAALLLMQVMGFSAREVAETLDTSVPAVNSALQRARRRMAETEAAPALTPDAAALAERYAQAFLRYDVDTMVSLLAEEVRFCMPPIPLWLQGRDEVARFLRGPGAECAGSVLVPIAANGAPAFAQYRHGGRLPWGVVVLDIQGGEIRGVNTFLDVGRLFPLFGMPAQLSPGEGPTQVFLAPGDEFAEGRSSMV